MHYCSLLENDFIPDQVKRRQCAWTKLPIECVPDPTQKPTDLWEVPQAPVDIDTQKCEALVTQESMYISSDRFVLNEGDVVHNGKWFCKLKKTNLSLSEHNIFGSKCTLKCDEGFAVIPDGENRRCRYEFI